MDVDDAVDDAVASMTTTTTTSPTATFVQLSSSSIRLAVGPANEVVANVPPTSSLLWDAELKKELRWKKSGTNNNYNQEICFRILEAVIAPAKAVHVSLYSFYLLDATENMVRCTGPKLQHPPSGMVIWTEILALPHPFPWTVACVLVHASNLRGKIKSARLLPMVKLKWETKLKAWLSDYTGFNRTAAATAAAASARRDLRLSSPSPKKADKVSKLDTKDCRALDTMFKSITSMECVRPT
jgi:hypothetical protein